MTHQIVVSIINYRTAQMTLACVDSVLDDIGDLDVHVVVVENGSQDGSDIEIKNWIESQTAPVPVTLVCSETNTGFSGGHNQGIAAKPADYYLLLNSDSVLRKGCLSALVAAAADDPQAGLICPQIETEEGEIQVNCFRFASFASELMRGACSGPVTRIFKNKVVALPPPVDPGQIEWTSFACVMLKASMIDAVGTMDENYFLYFEDADYCLRARNAGWQIRHVPEAVMVHFRGGSGPVKAFQRERKRLPPYYYASRSRFFWHRYGVLGPLGANLAWILGRLLQPLRVVLGKPMVPANERELRDIWINAFRPNGARFAPEDAS